MKSSILLVIITFLFTACGVLPKQEINFTKPKIQIPKKNPAPKNNKGSLYSMQGASLFADKKDLQVGDIIQIEISESLSADSNDKRELTSTRASNLGGGVVAAASSSLANKLNSGLEVGFSTNSSSSDKGAVKTQFDEKFETVISAIIQETYQNGNYFIKGSKELLIDGQKQEIIISGVIRPYDITSDNTVSSSQMANLKVLYDKEGEEANILETPWGTKLIRAIWPF